MQIVMMQSVIKQSVIMQSVIMKSVIKKCHNADCVFMHVIMQTDILKLCNECHEAKCHYAECHHADCRGAILSANPSFPPFIFVQKTTADFFKMVYKF